MVTGRPWSSCLYSSKPFVWAACSTCCQAMAARSCSIVRMESGMSSGLAEEAGTADPLADGLVAAELDALAVETADEGEEVLRPAPPVELSREVVGGEDGGVEERVGREVLLVEEAAALRGRLLGAELDAGLDLGGVRDEVAEGVVGEDEQLLREAGAPEAVLVVAGHGVLGEPVSEGSHLGLRLEPEGELLEEHAVVVVEDAVRAAEDDVLVREGVQGGEVGSTRHREVAPEAGQRGRRGGPGEDAAGGADGEEEE